MAKPIILSTGSTSGAGAAGEGRDDLVIGETVTLSDTEAANSGSGYLWAFEDIPIGSSSVLAGATTATPTYTPDVTGSYRVNCLVASIDTDTEIHAVPLAVSGGRIPSFEEEIEYDESGNAKGWHEAMTAWMRAVDTTFLSPSVVNQYTKQQHSAVVALTDAATTLIDAEDSNLYELTATGGVGATRELDNPTNLVKGMTWQVWFIQDGTGTRELTFDTFYDFGDEGSPTFAAQIAGIKNIITCVALSTTQIATTVLKGFA